MEPTTTPIPTPAPAATPSPAATRPPAHEQCEHCGSPVESTQRYCVVCGHRRSHVADPAAQYLAKAKAANRSRMAPASQRTGAPRRPPRGLGLGTALVLAVIPLAVGLGVILGRSSNSGDDKLIAALKAQKPEIIQTVGGGSGGAGSTSSGSSQSSSSTSTAVASLSSDFPLQTGYAVELQTLPANGTTTASVTTAKAAAAKKGAKQVGLIVQSDFKVTPSPPAGAYVLYSGSYNTQGEAHAALAKLKPKFGSAIVIKVTSTSAVAGAGRALTTTKYGTAHQVAGFKPSQAQVQQGQQAVQKIQSQAGKSYVNSQRGLPDVIVVK